MKLESEEDDTRSIITIHCFISWYFSPSVVKKNKLGKIMKMSCKIVGSQHLSGRKQTDDKAF